MPTFITITGTRSTGHRPASEYDRLFVEFLRPFSAASFYVGGATGIDTLALTWLTQATSSTVTVVLPGTLDDQPLDAQSAVETAQGRGRLRDVVELRHPDFAGQRSAEGYHARNRWMVDRSDFVVGFPLGTATPAGGTWYTIEYAAERGLPRLIVPV